MRDQEIHQGRNLKRIREILGIKQEAIAIDLGEDWTQKKVSLLEQKAEIEPKLLEQVAQILKVPVEAIKNFDEQATLNYITSFTDNSISNDNSVNHSIGNNFGTYNFTPLDKVTEVLDENKKLYERLLESEREKVAMLQALLDKK